MRFFIWIRSFQASFFNSLISLYSGLIRLIPDFEWPNSKSFEPEPEFQNANSGSLNQNRNLQTKIWFRQTGTGIPVPAG